MPGRTVLAIATLAAVLVGQPRVARAQVETDNNFKYNSGQEIQPIFEGWSHTPDGGFAMHFGYLNRNWVEKLAIPVGPQNSFEPGGPDRGQPTYFYTRTQRNHVQGDRAEGLGTARNWSGRSRRTARRRKAIGWLQPEWEIDPPGGASAGGQTTNLATQNKPPTLAIDPVSSATVNQKLTITAAVTDDGLPKPAAVRKPASVRRHRRCFRAAPTTSPSTSRNSRRRLPAAAAQVAGRPDRRSRGLSGAGQPVPPSTAHGSTSRTERPKRSSRSPSRVNMFSAGAPATAS